MIQGQYILEILWIGEGVLWNVDVLGMGRSPSVYDVTNKKLIRK